LITSSPAFCLRLYNVTAEFEPGVANTLSENLCYNLLRTYNTLASLLSRLYNVTIEFEPLGSWCGTLAQGQPRTRRPTTGYSFLDQLLGMPGAPGAASGIDFNLDIQDGLRASLNIGDLFDFNIQVR
jgi:hypothetical protein